jgi:micrococcal nuclease
MRRKTFLTAFLGAILFPTLLLAADFIGRVVGISDGDTILVMHDGKAEKIRLNGIDCPEKRQASGQRAKQFTSKLTFGQEVTVKTFGHDKYRRTIGDVLLADGRILNQELVKAGWRGGMNSIQRTRP